MFIKDKAQEQFGELKTRNNYTQLAGKPHAGWPTHKPKQSGTVLTSHNVGINFKTKNREHMKETELKYYYPYYIANRHDFRSKLKNIDSYYDQLLGKNEYYYKDEANHGYKRNIQDFSEKQFCVNSYIISVFQDWINWYKNGRNIFAFSKELLKMLEKTDVNEITYEAFNLPFDNFYISLRPLNLKIATDSDKIIEGVFVSVDRKEMEQHFVEDPNLPYDYAVSFHFAGDFEELKLKYFDKIWDGYGAGGVDFWQYSFFFLRKENVITIQDGINEAKAVFQSVNFPENAENVTDTELDVFNLHIKFIEDTSRILVNSLLYLSLPKKDKDILVDYPFDLPFNFNKKLTLAKTKKESGIIENKIKETGYSKIQYVGNSFKSISNHKSESGNNISPHWRRGHWRNQPFGKELKESKLIWIKPTIVNTHLGKPEKGHVYEIKN